MALRSPSLGKYLIPHEKYVEMTPAGAEPPNRASGGRSTLPHHRRRAVRTTAKTSGTPGARRWVETVRAWVSDLRLCRSETQARVGGGRVGLYAGFCGRSGLAVRAVTAIHLRPTLPPASSGLPAGSGGQPSNACAGACRLPLDLAPGGVYLAARVTSGAGGLLHHRFTLTRCPRTPGGLLSVALSRGLPQVGVTHHPALWSPDVPRRDPGGPRRGRPAGSSAAPPA